MSKELKIGYGILQPPIAEQLTAQGFVFDKKRVSEFEHIRDNLNQLRFSAMFTDSQFHKLLQKLQGKVASHIKAKNQLT